MAAHERWQLPWSWRVVGEAPVRREVGRRRQLQGSQRGHFGIWFTLLNNIHADSTRLQQPSLLPSLPPLSLFLPPSSSLSATADEQRTTDQVPCSSAMVTHEVIITARSLRWL